MKNGLMLICSLITIGFLSIGCEKEEIVIPSENANTGLHPGLEKNDSGENPELFYLPIPKEFAAPEGAEITEVSGEFELVIDEDHTEIVSFSVGVFLAEEVLLSHIGLSHQLGGDTYGPVDDFIREFRSCACLCHNSPDKTLCLLVCLESAKHAFFEALINEALN